VLLKLVPEETEHALHLITPLNLRDVATLK
jgi:hypothetical protein